jgi:hypothetical protein
MPKPLYVQSFEHFKDNHDDTLQAYVAYGLYIDAECKWAASQPSWPTNAKYKEWFECSIPHATPNHYERATAVLLEFANNIVERERAEFLISALEEFKAEAAKSEKGFWRGVFEALTGAALWTALLIAIGFILRWYNPDIYDVLGKILGKH